MKRALVLWMAVALVLPVFGRGADTPTNPEEIRGEAAIAEFPRQIQAANTKTEAEIQTNQIALRPSQPTAPAPSTSQPVAPSERHTWWFIGASLIILALVFMVSRKQSSSNPAEQ